MSAHVSINKIGSGQSMSVLLGFQIKKSPPVAAVCSKAVFCCC